MVTPCHLGVGGILIMVLSQVNHCNWQNSFKCHQRVILVFALNKCCKLKPLVPKYYILEPLSSYVQCLFGPPDFIKLLDMLMFYMPLPLASLVSLLCPIVASIVHAGLTRAIFMRDSVEIALKYRCCIV